VSNHRIAALVIACALALDAGLGVAYAAAMHIGAWDGLYNALANAVTLGGDVAPVGLWAHLVNGAECFTVIPLFAAALSFFTSGLTGLHIQASEGRLKRHLEQRLAEHHKSLAVVPPVRKPKNGSSERMATRAERAASQPTVSDSRQLRDPKGRFM
jgi:hypothetical protein